MSTTASVECDLPKAKVKKVRASSLLPSHRQELLNAGTIIAPRVQHPHHREPTPHTRARTRTAIALTPTANGRADHEGGRRCQDDQARGVDDGIEIDGAVRALPCGPAPFHSP